MENIAYSANAGASGRGALIVFEGLDRSGKSTQVQTLVDRLVKQHDVSVEHWRFPDRTTASGRQINDYLSRKASFSDQEVHKLFARNREEKAELLKQTLEAGTTVVVDRYAYSGVAYSAAKEISSLTFDWCKAADEGIPAADVVFFLNLDPSLAASRGGYGDELYEKLEFQQKVQQYFKQLREDSWHVIDASRPIEDISNEILAEALLVINACKAGQRPLAYLWENAAKV